MDAWLPPFLVTIITNLIIVCNPNLVDKAALYGRIDAPAVKYRIIQEIKQAAVKGIPAALNAVEENISLLENAINNFDCVNDIREREEVFSLLSLPAFVNGNSTTITFLLRLFLASSSFDSRALSIQKLALAALENNFPRHIIDILTRLLARFRGLIKEKGIHHSLFANVALAIGVLALSGNEGALNLIEDNAAALGKNARKFAKQEKEGWSNLFLVGSSEYPIFALGVGARYIRENSTRCLCELFIKLQSYPAYEHVTDYLTQALIQDNQTAVEILIRNFYFSRVSLKTRINIQGVLSQAPANASARKAAIDMKRFLSKDTTSSPLSAHKKAVDSDSTLSELRKQAGKMDANACIKKLAEYGFDYRKLAREYRRGYTPQLVLSRFKGLLTCLKEPRFKKKGVTPDKIPIKIFFSKKLKSYLERVAKGEITPKTNQRSPFKVRMSDDDAKAAMKKEFGVDHDNNEHIATAYRNNWSATAIYTKLCVLHGAFRDEEQLYSKKEIGEVFKTFTKSLLEADYSDVASLKKTFRDFQEKKGRMVKKERLIKKQGYRLSGRIKELRFEAIEEFIKRREERLKKGKEIQSKKIEEESHKKQLIKTHELPADFMSKTLAQVEREVRRKAEEEEKLELIKKFRLPKGLRERSLSFIRREIDRRKNKAKTFASKTRKSEKNRATRRNAALLTHRDQRRELTARRLEKRKKQRSDKAERKRILKQNIMLLKRTIEIKKIKHILERARYFKSLGDIEQSSREPNYSAVKRYYQRSLKYFHSISLEEERLLSKDLRIQLFDLAYELPQVSQRLHECIEEQHQQSREKKLQGILSRAGIAYEKASNALQNGYLPKAVWECRNARLIIQKILKGPDDVLLSIPQVASLISKVETLMSKARIQQQKIEQAEAVLKESTNALQAKKQAAKASKNKKRDSLVRAFLLCNGTLNAVEKNDFASFEFLPIKIRRTLIKHIGELPDIIQQLEDKLLSQGFLEEAQPSAKPQRQNQSVYIVPPESLKNGKPINADNNEQKTHSILQNEEMLNRSELAYQLRLMRSIREIMLLRLQRNNPRSALYAYQHLTILLKKIKDKGIGFFSTRGTRAFSHWCDRVQGNLSEEIANELSLRLFPDMGGVGSSSPAVGVIFPSPSSVTPELPALAKELCRVSENARLIYEAALNYSGHSQDRLFLAVDIVVSSPLNEEALRTFALSEAIRYLESNPSINDYPEEECEILTRKLADFIDDREIDKNNLLLANQLSEIYECLINLVINNKEVVHVFASEKQFCIESKRLKESVKRKFSTGWHRKLDIEYIQRSNPKIVLISNEDSCYTPEAIDDFINQIEDDVLFVINQGAKVFIDTGDNLKSVKRKDRRVVVLRSLPQGLRLAGESLSFAVAREELAMQLRKIRQPFSVNGWVLELVQNYLKLYAPEVEEKLHRNIEEIRLDLDYIAFLYQIMRKTAKNDNLEAYIPGDGPKQIWRKLRSDPDFDPSGKTIEWLAKLSSNESTEILPQRVFDIIIKRLKIMLERQEVLNYEAEFILARRAVAKYSGVKEDNIFLGNGVTEAILRVISAFGEDSDTIVMSDKSFVMYPNESMIRGLSIELVKNKDDLGTDFEGLYNKVVETQAKFLVLVNPRNPLGTVADRETIHSLIKRVRKASPNTIIIVDEAYYEFAKYQAKQECWKFPKVVERFIKRGFLGKLPFWLFGRADRNIIVLRSFSKILGLAGLRSGYAVANKERIKAMDKIKRSYGICALALPLIALGLREKKWIRKRCKDNYENRKYLQEEFRKLHEEFPQFNYISKIRTAGNFLFFWIKDKLCPETFKELIQRGLIARPLIPQAPFLRVTIGTREQCERAKQALKEILAVASSAIYSSENKAASSPMARKAVIWIRDGTLVERMHIVLAATAIAAKAYIRGRDYSLEFLINTFFKYSGLNTKEKLARFTIEHPGVKFGCFARYRAVKLYNRFINKDYPSVGLFEGAETLLKRLYEAGIQQCLISAYSHSQIEQWLQTEMGQKVGKYLTAYGTGKIRYGRKKIKLKKGLSQFAHIKELYGVEELYFVADAEKEMKMGKEAKQYLKLALIGFANRISPKLVVQAVEEITEGAVTIDTEKLNLPDQEETKSILRRAGADRIVKNMAELGKYFEKGLVIFTQIKKLWGNRIRRKVGRFLIIKHLKQMRHTKGGSENIRKVTEEIWSVIIESLSKKRQSEAAGIDVEAERFGYVHRFAKKVASLIVRDWREAYLFCIDKKFSDDTQENSIANEIYNMAASLRKEGKNRGASSPAEGDDEFIRIVSLSNFYATLISVKESEKLKNYLLYLYKNDKFMLIRTIIKGLLFELSEFEPEDINESKIKNMRLILGGLPKDKEIFQGPFSQKINSINRSETITAIKMIKFVGCLQDATKQLKEAFLAMLNKKMQDIETAKSFDTGYRHANYYRTIPAVDKKGKLYKRWVRQKRAYKDPKSKKHKTKSGYDKVIKLIEVAKQSIEDTLKESSSPANSRSSGGGWQRAFREIHEALNAVISIPPLYPRTRHYSFQQYNWGERKLFVMYGDYWSDQAMQLIMDKIVPLAINNPHDWLFLVEGIDSKILVESGHEVAFAYKVAKILHIPYANPIVSAYRDWTIYDEIAKRDIRFPSYKEVMGISLYISLSLIRHRQGYQHFKVTEEEYTKFAYRFPERITLEEIKSAVEWAIEMEKEDELLFEILRLRYHNLLIEIMNEKSREKLTSILEKFKDKGYLFVLFGKNQLPLIEELPGIKREGAASPVDNDEPTIQVSPQNTYLLMALAELVVGAIEEAHRVGIETKFTIERTANAVKVYYPGWGSFDYELILCAPLNEESIDSIKPVTKHFWISYDKTTARHNNMFRGNECEKTYFSLQYPFVEVEPLPKESSSPLRGDSSVKAMIARGLTYEEAAQWRKLKKERNISFTKGFWANKVTAINFIGLCT